MNDFFTQFKNKAREIMLTPNEKQVMRVRLYNFLEQNPLEAAVAPKTISVETTGMYVWFTPRFALPVVAILIVGLSSGTAFAAKGALPGDPLYPIKINVNEKVAVALATTPEAKAEVNASLATARLEEAESLASTGKLNANATAILATNFAVHAEAAQNNASSLENKDPGTAAQLTAEFDSNLAAHGVILSQIGDGSSNSETVKNSNALAMQASEHQRGRDAVLAIATDVSATGDASATASVSTFAAAEVSPQAQTMSLGVSASSSETQAPAMQAKTKSAAKMAPKAADTSSGTEQDAKVASALGAQASTSLSNAAKDFAAISKTIDSKTSGEVSDQLLNLQSLYATASLSMDAKNYLAAKEQYASVLRMSVKLDAYLKAGKKFNILLLSNLLQTIGKSVSLGQGSSITLGGNQNEKTPNSVSVQAQTDLSVGDGTNSHGGSDDATSSETESHIRSTDTNVSGNANVHL